MVYHFRSESVTHFLMFLFHLTARVLGLTLHIIMLVLPEGYHKVWAKLSTFLAGALEMVGRAGR